MPNTISSLIRYHKKHEPGPGQGDYEAHVFPFYFGAYDSPMSEEDEASGYTHFWPFYGRRWEGEDYRKHYFAYPLFALEGSESRNLSGFSLLWPLFSYRREHETTSMTFLGFIPWTLGADEVDPVDGTSNPAEEASGDETPSSDEDGEE